MSERTDATRMDSDAAHAEPRCVCMLKDVFAEADMAMPESLPESGTASRDESDNLYVGREFTAAPTA